jgi:predicted deacetylase
MSIIMKSSDGRKGRALLSVHDITPRWAGEVLDILADLKERSIPAVNLAVVPLHHRRDSWPGAPDFREAIRELGRDLRTEILLHGCYHLRVGGNETLPWTKRLRSRLQSAGEDEFFGLDPGEAAARLDLGRRVLGATFGVRAEGFIPPGWGFSRGLAGVCREHGLAYTEDQLFIHDLRAGKRLFSPVIAFATRSALRESLAGAWSRTVPRLSGGGRVLRLALHPADYRSAKTRERALRTLDRLSREREWRLYRDLFSAG